MKSIFNSVDRFLQFLTILPLDRSRPFEQTSHLRSNRTRRKKHKTKNLITRASDTPHPPSPPSPPPADSAQRSQPIPKLSSPPHSYPAPPSLERSNSLRQSFLLGTRDVDDALGSVRRRGRGRGGGMGRDGELGRGWGRCSEVAPASSFWVRTSYERGRVERT